MIAPDPVHSGAKRRDCRGQDIHAGRHGSTESSNPETDLRRFFNSSSSFLKRSIKLSSTRQMTVWMSVPTCSEPQRFLQAPYLWRRDDQSEVLCRVQLAAKALSTCLAVQEYPRDELSPYPTRMLLGRSQAPQSAGVQYSSRSGPASSSRRRIY